jgi:hypothetical protein
MTDRAPCGCGPDGACSSCADDCPAAGEGKPETPLIDLVAELAGREGVKVVSSTCAGVDIVIVPRRFS